MVLLSQYLTRTTRAKRVHNRTTMELCGSVQTPLMAASIIAIGKEIARLHPLLLVLAIVVVLLRVIQGRNPLVG